MSTLMILGVKPPDEKWLKMKNAYDSCKAAGLEIPDKVSYFFEDEEPDPDGVQIPLATQYDGNINKSEDCVTNWKPGEMCYGMSLDLSKLPKDIKILRFKWIY